MHKISYPLKIHRVQASPVASHTGYVKLLLIVLLCWHVLPLHAQQRPYYTQYILNNYIINPAIAGIENYTDVKVSHRHQWAGLEDAPVTTYLTIHAPWKKDDYGRETATGFTPDGENPRGRAYWRDYQASPGHSGIGLTLLNDRTGPLNRFAAYGTYAYHLPLTTTATLSMGFSAGIASMSLQADKLNFGNPAQIDPAVSANQSGQLKPDVSAGLWLYSRDYFAGIAIQQIVPAQLTFTDNIVQPSGNKLLPHTFITAGYRFFLTDDISCLPSVMLRYIQHLPLGAEMNTKFQYHDLVWIGGSYRYKDGYAGMVGINISNTVNLGYSYDVTTSGLKTVSKGSHELLIGFILGNKYNDRCPEKLW